MRIVDGKTRVHSVLLLASLLLFFPAAGLRAQAVAGEVLDTQRQPVAGADVTLFSASGRLVDHMRSTDDGAFVVVAPEGGPYRLHVAADTYRTVTGGPYDLTDGVDLEVYVVLHASPVQIDSIDVSVPQSSGRLAVRGFYDREKSGFGSFFDRREILQRGGISVGDLLRRLPNVRSDGGMDLFGDGSVQNTAIFVTRGTIVCRPAIWVDGILREDGGQGRSDPLRPDDWVNIDEIEGLEFYTGPSTIPVEFSHSGGCAALVVWTRGGLRG